MSKFLYFKRYLHIIDRLRSIPSDFETLQNYVIRQFEKDDVDSEFIYSARTFERDKKEIKDLFGIIIEYNRKDRVYYIDEDQIEDESVTRILEAFSIHNALKEGNKVTPSVFLEKRKPMGLEHINGIIYAIQNQYVLQFQHKKYWEVSVTQREVRPIALKESQHRWYLIAQDKKDEVVKSFGLDRISNLVITQNKFKPVTYDVEKEYRHSFGIEAYKPAEKVVLEFSWQQGNYVKSFPLHHSQTVLEDNGNELIVELYIRPTHDLVMELLKYGKEAEVVEPKWLKEEIMKHK